MNEFRNDVQSKTNDVNDSALGFIYSFVFFSLIFTIATVVKLIGS